MSRAKRLGRTLVGLGAMAIGAVPVVGGAIYVANQTRSSSEVAALQQNTARPVLAAPLASVAAPKRWARLPATNGALPVLAYHGISNDDPSLYTVTRTTFLEQMRAVRAAGFQAINIDQFREFMLGQRKALPPRPILVTFDDGRYDSFEGGDAILAATGQKAVMFQIGLFKEYGPFELRKAEVREMAASGRWDIQFHAGPLGHTTIPSGAKGRKGAFYGSLKFNQKTGRLETINEFSRRVKRDLDSGELSILSVLPKNRIRSFALPFGSYEGLFPNSPKIPGIVRARLRRSYDFIFSIAKSSDVASYVTHATPVDAIPRVEVHRGTSADALYCWLRARHPAHLKPGFCANPNITWEGLKPNAVPRGVLPIQA